MRRSRSKTFTGRRAQPCLATTAAAAVAAAGFLVVCPDVAAAAASGAIRGRPLETVIVVDAGSSGCRLNVYQVEWEGESMSVSGTSGGKIEPGLSSFADCPEDAAEHVRPLLFKASELVPAEKHSSTKIFIKSTAGMRLLPEETQEAIYNEIYDVLAGDHSFPFEVQREQLGTIDGDMEAFYAVLSANFLEERIDARLRSTSHHGGEVGALDMGGASTQIIFRPRWEEAGAERAGQERPQDAVREADGFPVAMSPEDFWSASHLGYGVAEVRTRVWAVLIDEHVRASPQDFERVSEGGGGGENDGQEKRTVENPCSFVNRVDSWKGFLLVGTGDHSSCERTVRAALWRDQDLECGLEADRACGLGGVTMPAPRGEFLAMSVFFYALHCLHELGPTRLEAWPNPSLRELREASQDFCAMDWEYMMHEDEEKGKARASHKFTTSVDALAHRCMETVYMTLLLRDGYGFPEHSRNVTYALKSNGMEVEWTLGFALAELARHYQVDPEADADERVEVGEVDAAGVSHPGAHESIRWKAVSSSPDCEHRPGDGSPDDNHTDSAMAFLGSSHASAGGSKRGKRRRRCHAEGLGDDRASSPSTIALLWCDARGTCWFEESGSGSGDDRVVGPEADRLDPVVGASPPKASSAPGAGAGAGAVGTAREAQEREETAGDNSAEGDSSGYGRVAANLFNKATTLLSARSSTWWDFLTGAGMITSPSLAQKGYGYEHLQQANERDLWALVQGWTSEAVKWTGFTMSDTGDD